MTADALVSPQVERLAPTRQIVPAITLDIYAATGHPGALAVAVFRCGHRHSGEVCMTQVQLHHVMDPDHPRHQVHVTALRRAIEMGLDR